MMLSAPIMDTDSSLVHPDQTCQRFSLADILSATNNFDETSVIGRGGFGKVYKCPTNIGLAIEVAVKRLHSMSNQGADEFEAEVKLLSKLRHGNLVSLIGYCNEEKEMVVVYEFMPNGTLEDHLRKPDSSLSWLQRLKICVGAARGLDYLHTGTSTQHGVIHRDVKTSNILLDANFAAKISDFGLAKIGLIDQTQTHVSASVKGTFGYMDPCYFYTGKLTRKSDVYAFGVVLFEVLSGRKAVDSTLDEEQWGLAVWAQDKIKEGKLNQIIDPRLNGQISKKCLKEFANIAGHCLHTQPKRRPTMAEVVVKLESILSQERESTNSVVYDEGFIYKLRSFFTGKVHSAVESTSNIPPLAKLIADELDAARGSNIKQSFRYFTYDELVRATNGFKYKEHSSTLNESIYKGWVDERTYVPTNEGAGVAVYVRKILTSKTDFKLEEVKHPNLAKLLGYCLLTQQLFCVYELNSLAAKHIKSVLARRHGSVKPNEAAIPEGNESEGVSGLDKSFGFSKHFGSKYELGEEVGRGHFGYTCKARFKKGALKGQEVAVKLIPKSKMTTAIAIEDVRREVEILRALPGHNNLVQFYDAYEDHEKVYVVMELCEGGELLDRILSRGGKYTEDDAKSVLIQIMNVVAFCHLQGVVHRDLKPENFLFTSKDENSPLKVIDFGLSDFVKPDERLRDIVGGVYYVAPEVLHRSYSIEADVWSIGVIAYILLCGSRPFWARSESGIFRAVLKADPSFDEAPWPTLSSEAKDFVKRLLNKDPRKRMTAAQGLSHPWIRNTGDEVKVPLDISILRLMKAYMRSSALRKAAFRALSKTLTVDELVYLKEQFSLLEPSKNGSLSMENIKAALMKHATDAMTEDFLASLSTLQYRRMDFEEFCAAAINIYQLEALDRWEQHARSAYELFEKDGNCAIMIEELASELGLSPPVPVHAVLHD